jgi:CysZ protein
MRRLKELFQGTGFLLEGFLILKSHPGLWVFALIPFIIDLLVFGLGVFWGSSFLGAWVATALGWALSPAAGIWYQMLYYPLLAVFWLVFLVLLGYLVFLLGAVVAAPFHSLLAERTLMKLGALQSRPFYFGEWIRGGLRMLMASLVKLVVFSLLGVFIFVASFIPGVNLLGSFMASLIVAFDSMDYSFEVKEWNFRRRVDFFRKEFPLFAGMGLSLGLTLLVPGLTLLVYPTAVVGAASRLAQSKALQKGV